MTDNNQNTLFQSEPTPTNQAQASNHANDANESLSIIKTVADMQAQFLRLQNLSRTQPINDWATRENQLDNLEVMLSDNQALLAKAISADFGYRSE